MLRRLSFLALALTLSACGSSVEISDESSAEDSGLDTGTSSDSGVATDSGLATDSGVLTDSGVVVEDTGPADTGPPPIDAPPGTCAAEPYAVDPASTLDPAIKGPLPTASKILTLPKLGTLTDVKVKVTYPTAPDGTPHPGRHAWVMFHHAVHGPYPGVVYDDYPTIHGHWASHGFYVVSIDGSRVFFPTSSGTSLTWTQQQTVAGMMSEAITWFLTQQEKTDFDFRCRLDLARVAVAGHSRGGGATMLVPTTRTDGASIRAALSLQGVDPGALNPPAGSVIPGFDLPAMWLDAALDGDVVFPINALQYGRARARASLVTILGSKHTFTFDANATPTQGGTAPTISPAEHKAVCVQYSTAFFRANVRDATPAAADLDRIQGPGGSSTTVSSGNVLLSWRPAKTFKFIAPFDDPAGGPLGKTVDGATMTPTGSMVATTLETMATSVAGMSAGEKAVSKEVNSLQLTWTTSGGGLEIPVSAGAFAGKKAVVFDLAMSSEGTTSGTTPLVLEVIDSTTATASVPIKDYLGAGWFTRPRRFSTAYVPLSKLTGVDTGKITAIRVVARSGAAAGTAMFDSLRLE